MTCFLSLAVTVLTLFACAAGRAADNSFPNRPVPDFNVMLNDDGDFTFVSKDLDQSKRFLSAQIDALVGTGVKTHVRCIGAGSDVLYYPTKVASEVGWRELPQESQFFKTAHAALAAGIDPLRILGDRAKADGIKYVLSVRMNDAHFASKPDDHVLTGKFWLDNKGKLMLPNNRWDFSKPEVRAYRQGIIFEVLDRYADVIDGIELDFNRHGMFFPKGTEAENARWLTEMLAATRQKLAEMEQKHGHPYYLFARVMASQEETQSNGMAVDEWMRRRLVDVVIPARTYDFSSDLPIEPLIKLANESGCKIYPAIYQRTQFSWPLVAKPNENSYAGGVLSIPSPEMVAGAAANYWWMGVSGFETYNYRTPPGPITEQTVRRLLHPAVLTTLSASYMVTPHHGRKVPSQTETPLRPPEQLPAELTAGKPFEAHLLVGGKLEGGPIDPSYVGLRLGLTDVTPQTKLRITLNGKSIFDGEAGPVMQRVTGKPDARENLAELFPKIPEYYLQVGITDVSIVRQGKNDLNVTLVDAAEGARVGISEAMIGVIREVTGQRVRF